MRLSFFDTHRFEREAFTQVFEGSGHEIVYLDVRLNEATAKLAQGSQAVVSFVSDRLDRPALENLKAAGVSLVCLRSAGFNHVDLPVAKQLSIAVVRVPAYSPYAVAEHAVALLMTVNRKIHRAYSRVRELNFSLEGLVGFDVHGKTVGVLGTGRIGEAFLRIMAGFGCRLLAFDVKPRADLAEQLGVTYVSLERLYQECDVISLHLPLMAETKHIVDAKAFAQMKPGVVLLNTGRGALIDTKALLASLKSKRLGGAGLDVYEVEEGVFFNDLSEKGVDDDLLARLLTFPNVVITSHQGFLTREALANIAQTTLENVNAFAQGKPLVNAL